MSKVVAEYEHLPEFIELAKKIMEKHVQQFGGLDLNKICPVVIVNKDRSENKKQLWQIVSVPMPIKMDCKYSFYIIMYASDWEGMLMKHKLLLVTQILFALPLSEEDEMDGKTNLFDMKDFGVMLRTFGPDYIVRDDVPDILADDFKWKE